MPDSSPAEPYSRRAMFVVDWDGTCVEEIWPGMGDWLPGAVDALRELSSLGRTVIYSLRCHYYEQDDFTPRPQGEAHKAQLSIRRKLREAGLEDIEVYANDRGKPPGLFYIDDRGLRFDGDWPAILRRVKQDMAVELSRTPVRVFESGATRDTDEDKLDYEGFLSPLVLQRFAEYMHTHRVQSDGSVRASDNWQKGIPLDSAMKSGYRHFMDWWMNHRGYEAREDIEVALCAVIFNAQSYLHTLLAERMAASHGCCQRPECDVCV